MKLFIFSLATVLLLQTVTCQTPVAPERTCESVLPANVCTTLRDVATKFNENAAIVNQAVTDAFNHHKTRATEVLAYVKEYLVTRANNFKCENVISADSCTKINDIATKLHLTATQASLAVREAIVNGATKVQDIYSKAVVYMRDRLSQLTCENVLGAEKCKAVREFAAAAHLKAGEVNKAVREAIIEGASTLKDQYQKAIDFLSTEITCEKVLGEKACDRLRTAATELKEKTSAVHEAVVAALKKHYTTVSDIISSVQETLVTKAVNFKCTDILEQAKCDKVDEIAARLTLTKDQVLTAVKEAVVNSAAQATEIYNRALGFLLNDVKNLKCEDLASADTCTKLTEFATKIHVKTTNVALAVKEAIIQGASNTKEFLAQGKEFLEAKISCDKVLSETTCDKIRNMADKFHISLKEVDAFMREAIANGATKVSDIYKKVTTWIVEKWTGVFGDEQEMFRRAVSEEMENLLQVPSSDEVVSVYRRSTREKLEAALKKAKGKTVQWINDMIKKSDAYLEKVKAWIKEKLEKDGITTRGDEVDQDMELAKDMARRSIEAMASEMEDESFNEKIVRLFETYVVDKVLSDKHRAAVDTWINENKTYIKWLMGFTEKLGESYIAKLMGDFFAATSIFG